MKRSSRLEMFCKKDVLKHFTKFTGKHLFQSLFLNKVARLGAVNSRATWRTFKPKLEKLKRKRKTPTLKKFLIFSQKKIFLIFREIELSSSKLKTLIF